MSTASRWIRPAVVALLAWAALPGGLAAQATGGSPFPDRLRAWRPLHPVAELGSSLVEAPGPASLLTVPGPRIGLFWTGGNPAALPDEVGESWTAFTARYQTEDGEYRRPLDPVEVSDAGVHALSWGPVSDWGAAIGEVSVVRRELSPNSFADALDPYRGVPYVLTDTGRVDTRHTRARLEGGLGIELGRWRVGVAGGYRATDNRTRETGFPRIGREAAYGATLGVSRGLGDGALRVGAYGRYRGQAESMTLAAIDEGGRVHMLSGFTEPQPIELPVGTVFRRAEVDALVAGVSAAGGLAGFEWVLLTERGRSKETQIGRSQAEPDDPFDRWDTDEWRVAMAAQRRLGQALLLTLGAGWDRSSGEALLPGFEEVVYRASVVEWTGEADLRWLPERSDWSAAVRADLSVQRRERIDRLEALFSDLTLALPRAGADVAKRFGAGFGIEGGYAIAYVDPSGSIPELADLGPVARELIGGELALIAAGGTAHHLHTGAHWSPGSRLSLWLRGGYRWSSAGAADLAGLSGHGDTRTGWDALIGAVIRP